jgi:quercetin dioxygenase-like cupin family protein
MQVSNDLRISPALLVAIPLLLLAPAVGLGQASMRPCPAVAERTGAPGPACFTAKEELGELPAAPLFWHLDVFSSLEAAQAARTARGTVVESLGKVWLFTIGERGWQGIGGDHVAVVGPLPVKLHLKYTAVYMESTFTPGTKAPIHMHSGTEAFYTLTGDTCLETPDGVQVARGPGNVVIVPGGPPMLLMAIGKEMRTGVVLILHDSSQPPTTMIHDWTPKGLCDAQL